MRTLAHTIGDLHFTWSIHDHEINVFRLTEEGRPWRRLGTLRIEVDALDDATRFSDEFDGGVVEFEEEAFQAHCNRFVALHAAAAFKPRGPDPHSIAPAARAGLEAARPQTPREALLMIRMMTARESTPAGNLGTFERRVDEIAEEGLAPRDPTAFELTDHLADALAEAHRVLTRVRARFEGESVNPLTEGDDPMLDVEIDTALALPPDLEAMVERRL